MEIEEATEIVLSILGEDHPISSDIKSETEHVPAMKVIVAVVAELHKRIVNLERKGMH